MAWGDSGVAWGGLGVARGESGVAWGVLRTAWGEQDCSVNICAKFVVGAACMSQCWNQTV